MFNQYSRSACTLSLLLFLIGTGFFNTKDIHAQNISFETENSWNLGVTGAIPVFVVTSGHNNFSSNGADQTATRVMSGFNPANVTFTINAPSYNGIDVQAVFQINHHLQGSSIQNDGLFEGRVAEIIVSGNFGSINAGKGLGIFGSSSIADAGSGLGVGRFGGPDAANATLGRIGSGYTYANFNPRVMYTTPGFGGLKIKAGIINPEKPGGASNDIETAAPRFEAQADYRLPLGEKGAMKLWIGGLYQNVSVISADYDFSYSGYDAGIQFSFAGFTLRGAFSQTNSIGADGLIGLNISGGTAVDQADADGTQWYGEATYDLSGFLLGASYGEGRQDATTTDVGSVPEVTNELLMAFARYDVTPNLKLLVEAQSFASESQADYAALILGTQITF